MSQDDPIMQISRCGPAEILPLKTLTVPPYTTTNTVVYGLKQFIVIDPAPSDPKAQEFLRNHLEKRIAKGAKLLGFYLTHHHGDHCGAAMALSRFFAVPVLAHQKAQAHLSFTLDYSFSHDEKIAVDDGLIDALYTPGHADSHMVYYDKKHRILIAGDMITDRGCVLIPPGSGSLTVYLESMDRLSMLELETIIPAHGQPITKNAKAFLIRAIHHRMGRIAAILAVLEQEKQSRDATDITMAVYKETLQENMLAFAQLSVESSLNWLLEKGLAQKTPQYQWVATRDEIKKEQLLVSALRELDERLRNA